MDALRRKLVLTAPWAATALLTGCGGGGDDARMPGDEREAAMATRPTSSNTLMVTAIDSAVGLDSIWAGSGGGGGNRLVPSTPPVVHGVISGSEMWVSMVEMISPPDGSYHTRTLRLKLNNGARPVLNATYKLSAEQPAHIQVERQTGSGKPEEYRYRSVEGVITIVSVSPDGRTFGLGFAAPKFLPLGNSLATRSFLLRGLATLTLPAEQIAWI